MSEFKEKVISALNAAEENGEFFEGWTPDEIAQDLIDYNAEFENTPISELSYVIDNVFYNRGN